MAASKSGPDAEQQIKRWRHVPKDLQYLRRWAARFGLRGLTVYFGQQPPLSTLASNDELAELELAYRKIASRGDAQRINRWCHSIRSGDAANEAKEQIRGLLLLFELLADRGLSPYSDGQVRFVSPQPPPFDWNVLPRHLSQWIPWLKMFEELRTENDFFQFAQNADVHQLRQLTSLDDLLRSDGHSLRAWCETNNIGGKPAANEAFQAEWLFLFVYFAKSRIAKRRGRNGKGRKTGQS